MTNSDPKGISPMKKVSGVIGEHTLVIRPSAVIGASAGQFDGQGDHHTPPAYVEKAFRKYLECGPSTGSGRHLRPRLYTRPL